MSNVVIESHEKFAIVRMTSGTTNAINPGLIKELYDAIQAVKLGSQGFIIAGGNKFFSIGFDLPELLTLNEVEMSAFLANFDALIYDIFVTPMPTICVMSGHAVGGGNILALTCDFRYAAETNKRMGLNEIHFGLPVPYLADLILRQLLGDRPANNILYGGELLSMNDACQIGLVDDLYSSEDLEIMVSGKMTGLIALPLSGYSAIKENRIEAIAMRFKMNQIKKRELFIHHWFSQPIQKLLKEASEKF